MLSKLVFLGTLVSSPFVVDAQTSSRSASQVTSRTSSRLPKVTSQSASRSGSKVIVKVHTILSSETLAPSTPLQHHQIDATLTYKAIPSSSPSGGAVQTYITAYVPQITGYAGIVKDVTSCKDTVLALTCTNSNLCNPNWTANHTYTQGPRYIEATQVMTKGDSVATITAHCFEATSSKDASVATAICVMRAANVAENIAEELNTKNLHQLFAPPHERVAKNWLPIISGAEMLTNHTCSEKEIAKAKEHKMKTKQEEKDREHSFEAEHGQLYHPKTTTFGVTEEKDQPNAASYARGTAAYVLAGAVTAVMAIAALL